MLTALALKWYVTSNTHNPNWTSFNISQCFTLFSPLFPAPGSESSHTFGGLPWCKNLWSFLCILAIIFHGSIVLTSHWPLCVHCFTSLVSFTGFYTEDEPIFCLLGVGKSVFLYGIWPNLFYCVSYRQSYQPFTAESQVILAFSFIILEISASFSNSLKLSSAAAILDFTHTARGADETVEIWEPLDTSFQFVQFVEVCKIVPVSGHNFSLLFSPLIRREIQNWSKIYQEAYRKRPT